VSMRLTVSNSAGLLPTRTGVFTAHVPAVVQEELKQRSSSPPPTPPQEEVGSQPAVDSRPDCWHAQPDWIAPGCRHKLRNNALAASPTAVGHGGDFAGPLTTPPFGSHVAGLDPKTSRRSSH